MKKSKTKNPRLRQRSPAAPTPSLAAPIRPSGKLGLIIQRLERKSGATTDELAEATGWQKHSVLGALSRLRARGFAVRLETLGNRKAYQLDRAEG